MSQTMRYDLADIESGELPHLNAFMNTLVAQFYVEFLQQGGGKPHVVFHINSSQPIRTRTDDGDIVEVKGCLIGVDYTGPGLKGTFLVKLIDFQTSSTSARAAFQFPLRNTQLRVFDLITILRGQGRDLPSEHQSDLTRFDFVEANVRGELDGCRDAVSQWMIRLHALNVVGWAAIGQGVGNIEFQDFAHFVPTNNFHHIIGNNYTNADRPNYAGITICYITPMPLHRGTFRSRSVNRIETYGTARLPYHPAPSHSSRSHRSHR